MRLITSQTAINVEHIWGTFSQKNSSFSTIDAYAGYTIHYPSWREFWIIINAFSEILIFR